MTIDMKRLMVGLTVIAMTAGASGQASSQIAPTASDRLVAIMGATVFDGTGAAPRKANVIIRDGRIAEVGEQVRAPRGAKVIRAEGKALLPGFFDVHTHWASDTPPYSIPEVATAYIKAGVTTVNDFHQPPEAFALRREWLSQLATPHVNLTARLSTPGGHGSDWRDDNMTRTANTPEGGKAAVEIVAAYKPDTIKVFADGWRYGGPANNTSMDEDTLSAIVEESHKRGLKVLTHTVTADRGVSAGVAKVDVIGHSIQDRLLTADEIAKIKAGGTAYTGTLALSDPQKRRGPAPDMNDPAVQRRERNRTNAMANMKALFDAGVPMVVGTDAGMPGTPHGYSTLREMELMVDAGLTPTDALIAGTANSAKALGLGDDRGTIQPGKRADLVLIDGAPWANIADIHKTDRVFVDGRMVIGPGVALPAANGQRIRPPGRVAALIDDFERADNRTSIDTLRLDEYDEGRDRSRQVVQVIDRVDGGKALSVAARMAQKPAPYAGVIFPFTKGAESAVDVSEYSGVKLDIRGDGGEYEVRLVGLEGAWSAKVEAGAAWRSVDLPFTALTPVPLRNQTTTAPWTPKSMYDVRIVASRKAGGNVWFEVDNLKFY